MSTAPLPRVLIGDVIYERMRDWAPLPLGIAAGRISTLAVDSRDRLYVLRRGAEPSVLVYDAEGRFLTSFADDLVSDAHGIAIDKDDRVFVVDRDAHQVICLTTSGVELLRLGTRNQPKWNAPFNHPTDVAVAPDGTILVADGYGNGNVHMFTTDGVHSHTFGVVGRGRGEFMTPHALIIDRQNRILVADRENNRVQVFDIHGEWLSEYGGLCRPMDLFECADGAVLVTDIVPSVSAFSPGGQRIGRGRPSLNGAHGITGDAKGTLYLAEIEPNSITRLTPV